MCGNQNIGTVGYARVNDIGSRTSCVIASLSSIIHRNIYIYIYIYS